MSGSWLFQSKFLLFFFDQRQLYGVHAKGKPSEEDIIA